LSRGHWSIENRVHWVRDVTYDEDRCRVRKGAAAQSLATLRNLALNLFRLGGARNIAAATRACAARPGRVLALLGV
jgi:hypothetical protein